MNIRNLIIVLIVFIGIVLTTILIQTKDQGSRIEKNIFNPYIFIDGADVIHSDANCMGIAKPTRDFKVVPCMVDSVTKENLNKICSRCITEDQFTYLIEKADRNSINKSK